MSFTLLELVLYCFASHILFHLFVYLYKIIRKLVVKYYRIAVKTYTRINLIVNRVEGALDLIEEMDKKQKSYSFDGYKTYLYNLSKNESFNTFFPVVISIIYAIINKLTTKSQSSKLNLLLASELQQELDSNSEKYKHITTKTVNYPDRIRSLSDEQSNDKSVENTQVSTPVYDPSRRVKALAKAMSKKDDQFYGPLETIKGPGGIVLAFDGHYYRCMSECHSSDNAQAPVSVPDPTPTLPHVSKFVSEAPQNHNSNGLFNNLFSGFTELASPESIKKYTQYINTYGLPLAMKAYEVYVNEKSKELNKVIEQRSKDNNCVNKPDDINTFFNTKTEQDLAQESEQQSEQQSNQGSESSQQNVTNSRNRVLSDLSNNPEFVAKLRELQKAQIQNKTDDKTYDKTYDKTDNKSDDKIANTSDDDSVNEDEALTELKQAHDEYIQNIRKKQDFNQIFDNITSKANGDFSNFTDKEKEEFLNEQTAFFKKLRENPKTFVSEWVPSTIEPDIKDSEDSENSDNSENLEKSENIPFPENMINTE